MSAFFLFGCIHQNADLSGEYRLQNAPENAEITLTFTENEFAGLSAVNRYFGTFERDHNKIKFNVAGTTMMMGPQNLMTVEQEYIKALADINVLIQKKDMLILQTDNQDKLIFIKTK